MPVYLLAIESSCDDTSAAVFCDNVMRSNVIASQKVHETFGGVVPELASRAHQQNIIPTIDKALKDANIDKKQLHAVAFTRGPGLLGSLLVGTTFAKSFAQALEIPMIDVNHMQAHVLAHFIQNADKTKAVPEFPFLCLTVSGGHTQIVLVSDYFDMKIVGQTIDDAAGEAFDKAAKILDLPYPGGPFVDKNAQEGNPLAFQFAKPRIPGFDYSFSGLKTSFLYFLRDHLKSDPLFIEKNLKDLCASFQKAVIDALMDKLLKAAKEYNSNSIAIAGGVSANSGLRKAISDLNAKGFQTFIPEFQFTTDNAAMVAITGYLKYIRGEFASPDLTVFSRSGI